MTVRTESSARGLRIIVPLGGEDHVLSVERATQLRDELACELEACAKRASEPEPPASNMAYIDEQELARRTTLSRTTLQTLRREGGGPKFAKLGHRVVYRLADVERWIAERTRAAGTKRRRPRGTR